MAKARQSPAGFGFSETIGSPRGQAAPRRLSFAQGKGSVRLRVLFQIFADLYANEQQDEKGPGAEEKKIDAGGIHRDLPCHASNSRPMSPLYDGRNGTTFPAC